MAHSAEQFLNYPFETDEAYQVSVNKLKLGLLGIISNGALEGKSDNERESVMFRSKLFYYNRTTGSSLSEQDIQEHKAKTSTQTLPEITSVLTSPQEPEPRTLTFAELKELIESGKTDQIPNNRQIPDHLHTAPPSTSVAAVRKKPWEIAREESSQNPKSA